jgi:ketosteroid isomerase-like protein
MQDDTIATNKQIARQFFLNFERGDVEAVIGLFATNASYWIPTDRKEYGMTEFKEALRWIQSRLNGGIRFELGPVVAEQDRVCIQAESFATTTDGKSFNNLYHIFFAISGGKIAYAREYNDTAHVFGTLRA